MKLSIDRNALNNAIQRVSRAISSRTTVPILSGIKMDATYEAVTLTASDTIQSIQTRIPTEVGSEVVAEVEMSGSIVLPAKFLIELIKKLPAGNVSIEVDGATAKIKAGKSKAEIVGMDPDEFPELPSVSSDSLSIPADQLRMMIESTVFATSADENTPVLQGVLLTLAEGRLQFTATNRHRLAQCVINVESDQQYSNIIVSAKHLADLSKVLPDKPETVTVAVSGGWMLFQFGDTLFYSRLVDGTYPDTTKIIPTDFQTEVEIATDSLQDAIDRAHLISREEKTNVVRLAITDDGSAVISSAASQLGSVAEELQLSLEGEPIKVAFNSKYMLDALKVIDTPDVYIGFTGPLSPIIIKPVDGADMLHLVLPYRISD